MGSKKRSDKNKQELESTDISYYENKIESLKKSVKQLEKINKRKKELMKLEKKKKKILKDVKKRHK